MGQRNDRIDVESQHVVVVFGGHLEEALARTMSGVVHEEVDGTLVVQQTLGHFADAVLRGKVSWKDFDVDRVPLLEFFLRGLESGLVSCDDDQIVTVACQVFGKRAADTGSSSRYETRLCHDSNLLGLHRLPARTASIPTANLAVVIADESGRYVLTQLNENTLWRYDRRWRRSSTFQPFGDMSFAVIEGEHQLAAVSQREAGGGLEAKVLSPRAPALALATANYVDTWVFEGDPQVWANVPEYVITRQKDGTNGLLRIADDAEIDPLEGFGPVHQVAQVPNSRLVVLGGSASYTVYDPIAMRSIRHFELAGKNQTPFLRFRHEDELWINDTDTMLKIETRQFEVVDAAGSDIDPEVNGESSPHHGGFGRWAFAAHNELCVVTRPRMGDVLVLDTMSMLPVARGVFKSGVPLEALLVGRNSIVAVDAAGNRLRTRLKKVGINFETVPAD